MTTITAQPLEPLLKSTLLPLYAQQMQTVVASEQRDRGTKFDDYAAHGVMEYWFIDPQKLTVEQYVLRDSSYELLFKVGSGDLISDVIVGFTIPVQAIFERKLANRVLVEMIGKSN